MKKLIVAVAIVALPLIGGFDVSAAPINCPPGQEATKTGDWWDCVNNGGNENESDKDKNPNGHPRS